MSSSFLNPCVTPWTALATRARARPCSARCSSVWRTATSTASFCSKRMPGGSGTLILPLGPCTSTALAEISTFTPAGTGIGLRPIRDMSLSFSHLPDFAEHFPADAGPARSAPGHQSAGRGQDADAEAAHDGADARGTDAAPIRGVLQEQPQRLAHLVLVHKLEGRNVTFFFEDARNLGLEFRRRHIHARMLGAGGIADARQQVSDRIRIHRIFPFAPYQLALSTPGISPFRARPRKQIRHIWNLLK